MNLSNLDNALWAAGFIGHVSLVLVLVLRKRVQEFPVFTGFIAFEALTTILLFLVSKHGSRHGYFLAYWATGLVDYIFQVAVVWEVARDVLRPTGAWVRDARNAFVSWGLAGLIAAAALAFQIGPPQSQGFDLWDVRITVFTSLLTCELFIAMSAAANRLGLQQRTYVFALGRGFFVWMFSSLLEEFGRAMFGWNLGSVIFVHIREGVYLSVLLYWTVIFWLPERARLPLSAEMNAYLVALHRRVQYDLTSIDERRL